jgi:hypothetical protein
MLTVACALAGLVVGCVVGYVYGSGAVIAGVRAEREKTAEILAACVVQTEAALNLLRDAKIVVVPPPHWGADPTGTRKH